MLSCWATPRPQPYNPSRLHDYTYTLIGERSKTTYCRPRWAEEGWDGLVADVDVDVEVEADTVADAEAAADEEAHEQPDLEEADKTPTTTTL
jgi:hypothetical protein